MTIPEFSSVEDLIRGRVPLPLPEEIGKLGGVTIKMASFDQDEYDALINLLDKTFYKNSLASAASIVAENILPIIDLIRVVKTNTKEAFAGVRAKGRQLTLELLTADVLPSVWGNANPANYEYTISSTGSLDYIGSASSPVKVGEEEGQIYLGFIEPVPVPKINKLAMNKNGEPYPYLTIDWSAKKDNIACLPEPWIFPPESNYYIRVSAYKTGDTEFTPIGFRAVEGMSVLEL